MAPEAEREVDQPLVVAELADLDAEAEKGLRKALDLRLLPWVVLGYIVNGLDRNNLSNAYTLGMDKDLNMINDKGYGLQLANLYFFITYVVCQVLGNSLIPRLRPSIFLPAIMIIWGVIAASMAAIHDTTGLNWARAALGIAEAGFYPGVIYLLGSWYPKSDLGLRIAIFTLGQNFGSSLSGLISAVLASTVTAASEATGLPAWRVLFLVEGLLSIVVAVPGFFLLPDYPTNTRWMNEEHKRVALKRMEAQGNNVQYTGYSWAVVKNLLIRPYFYLFCCIFPILNFLPQIINNFIFSLKNSGWSASLSNYMTVPVYLVAAALIPIVGWSSDKFRDRFYHGLIGTVWAMVLYAVLMVNDANAPTALLFVVVYLLTPCYAIYPLMMGWVNELWRADNQTRALAIAIFNSVANIIPSYTATIIWLPGDAPRYYLGKLASIGLLACLALIIVAVGLLERNKILLPVDKDGKSAVERAEAIPTEIVLEKGALKA
ncbi:major facilitator superfamily domain-containing protein [Cladochytrium replicatum]|nr:major facilitator superfamily domain-containing protein [Cladochytrium replicatum]